MSGDSEKRSDATHEAWMGARRPGSRQIIAKLWRPEHKFAFVNGPLLALSKSGRVVSDSRPEKNRARLKRFYGLRGELSVALSSGAASADEVRERLRSSEFGNQLLFAASKDEAVECLAECLIHDNAIVDSGYGCVLFLETWQD